MKKLIPVIVIPFITTVCIAQTSEEWFQQKRTQKRYLLQQVAALKVYAGYVRDGYSIAREGLQTINSIRNGDFNLHDDFFHLLKTVNPTIKKFSKVAAIIALQIKIIKRASECMLAVREINQFTSGEMRQFDLVISNLLSDVLTVINELWQLTTNGQLEMKDGERLERINLLYEDMQDKYGFCFSYTEETTLLAVQRMRETHEINLSRKLNGLQ